MSERLPQDSNPFSALVSAIMIGVGLLAFIAIFALLAWSPDLASKNRAGQHPYSTSALGYGGLIKLLEADGQTVTVEVLDGRISSRAVHMPGLGCTLLPAGENT